MRWIPTELAALLSAAVSLGALAQQAHAPGRLASQPGDVLDPAHIPLVEVIGAREEAIQGVMIAPTQILLSPGDKWSPGARVRRVDTGDEAPVRRILNWGGRGAIEWVLLEVEWQESGKSMPLTVAEEDAVPGELLRVVSWRDNSYTVVPLWLELALCPSCTHHLRTSESGAPTTALRLGSPVLNERRELVGLLHGLGFQLGAGFIRSGAYANIIPAGRFTVEAVEPATEQRFAEVLRDQKASRAAQSAALAACSSGKWSEALAAAREAVQLDPNQGRAWMALGCAAAELDRFAVAVIALRNALRRRCEPAYTSGALASVLARSRDRQAATQLALSIESQWPQDVRALSSAAFALLTADRLEDAGRLLRRILELDPENVWALEMLDRVNAIPGRG